MDAQIIISSAVSFLFFLILHSIIFSRINHAHVLEWIVKTCLIGAISPFLFALWFSLVFPVVGYSFPLHFSSVFIVAFILYSLMSIGYILGVFGLMESSLRIRILEHIAQAGRIGVHKKDLYREYNRDVIIGKRLKRFIQSKNVIYRNGLYTMKKRFSYFIIHAFIFESVKKLYNAGANER